VKQRESLARLTRGKRLKLAVVFVDSFVQELGGLRNFERIAAVGVALVGFPSVVAAQPEEVRRPAGERVGEPLHDADDPEVAVEVAAAPAVGPPEEPVVEVLAPQAGRADVGVDALVVAHEPVKGAHRPEDGAAVLVNVLFVAAQTAQVAAAAEEVVDDAGGDLAGAMRDLHAGGIQWVDEKVGVAD
jgi:hypothetical protein